MKRLSNTTNSVVDLPSGHVIKPGQSIDVDPSVLTHTSNRAYLNALILKKNVVVEDVKEKRAAKKRSLKRLTRETIAKGREPFLIECLAAHGCEVKPGDHTLQELRALAGRVIFADL